MDAKALAEQGMAVPLAPPALTGVRYSQQHLIVLRKANIASDTQQLQLQLNGQYGFEQLLKEVTCNMVAASWQRMLQSEKQLLGQKRTMSQSSIILPSNPRFYELTSLL